MTQAPPPPKSGLLNGSLESHKYTVVEAQPPGEYGFHNFIVHSTTAINTNLPAGTVQMVHFQEGPIAEVGVNGIMDENVLAMVLHRLRYWQNGPFACRENAIAITKIEEALLWLNKRTSDRERRGVEGTHLV